MLTRGEFSTESKTYGTIVNYTKNSLEIILLEGTALVSAYKSDVSGEYCFNNIIAKEAAALIKAGVRGCNKKNGMPAPFALGAIMQHEFEKSKAAYIVQMYDKELAGIIVDTETLSLKLDFSPLSTIPSDIPYIKLTTVNTDKVEEAEDELDAIPIRTVEEIALTKDDVSWLKNKKYFIVNNDETAEKLFEFLDNYSGPISYDTETTGLKINCFGKINSKYQHELIKHNNENPDAQIRADKLVGIIFCVEKDVSYYFPVGNRKFKNLYDEKDSPIRKKLIQKFKHEYTTGKYMNKDSDFASYWRDTPEDLITSDCILMERCRKILEEGHIVAHNGAFEWKVGWQYEIDTNLKDDTMIMHQLMYKFRSTTSNRGESSSLKYLAKRELDVDQWELSDFFVNYKEDNSGLTRANKNAKKKKKSSLIDFSYMDYAGSRIYAPTDGDVTLQLFLKYKRDMKENHAEMEYIYNVEVLVACAVGYMEFYGHRLDMTKVMQIRQDTITKIALLESEIRQNLNFTSKEEQRLYDLIKDKQKTIKSSKDDELVKALNTEITELTEQLSNSMATDEEHPLNLASPAQVAEVFYTPVEEGGCGYKFSGDKPSVAKKEIKALIKEKNPDGTAKNIVAWLYSEYKKEDTLLTKFFDNLIYYTYPGGFIFSSFGQISTATGRMSCIRNGTYIETVKGKVKIEDIRAGDKVYCLDKLGKVVDRQVLNVINQGIKDLCRISYKGGYLECTKDHKIKVNGRWKRADNLKVGDVLITKDGVTNVIKVELDIGISDTVWDLEIEENHNFITGMNNGVVVHNCSKPRNDCWA